jgi:uncharacterized membrane protein YciS (DUF1049 family)
MTMTMMMMMMMIMMMMIGSNNDSNIPTTYIFLLLVYSLQKLLQIPVSLKFEIELSCIVIHKLLLQSNLYLKT